jgi:multidrug efflux pump subunit AcrB
VLCVWLLKPLHDPHANGRPSIFSGMQNAYAGTLRMTLHARWMLALIYGGAVAAAVFWWLIGHPGLGMDVFPAVDSGQFQLRVRAPAGTTLEDSEKLAQDVLEEVAKQAGGEDKIDVSVSLVGTASYNYPINSIFLWTSGPQESVLRIALKRNSGIRIEPFKAKLRDELPKMQRAKGPQMKDVGLSFEAGDIVAQVMGFGANTPVEVAIHGPNMADNLAHAAKIRSELEKIPSLRDLAYDQALSYPSLEVIVNREKAADAGVTPEEVGNAFAPWTLSSRFVTPNYWRDPKSGVGYQVQVEVENASVTRELLGQLPVKRVGERTVRVEDVAEITDGNRPGQVDRYNMRRQVTITANVEGEDLGRVADRVEKAIKAAGEPPRGVIVSMRGQVVPMRQMFGPLAFEPPWQVPVKRWFEGLSGGLIVAVGVILLLLTAYFQSIRLALVVVSTAPAVIIGVGLALVLTRTTLNIQSFMGAIMAIGVAVANAILLATFAEQARTQGMSALDAAVDGARHRLRPILMTSCAMIAGMLPMASGLGEGGEQTAPLGRAVIGGLAVATFATLFLLPSVFVIVMGRSSTRSASLDPDDPHSKHHDTNGVNGDVVKAEASIQGAVTGGR